MTSVGETNNSQDSIRGITMVTYACYAVGLFLAGIPTLVGVIIAYVKRPDAKGTIFESHLTWLIRTFWIGFILGFIGFVLTFILIGIPIIIAAGIWTIYRIVVGFLKLNDGKPMPNPTAFF